MFNVYTIYKTCPEFHSECETEEQAQDLVEELKQDKTLDDAYYMEDE